MTSQAEGGHLSLLADRCPHCLRVTRRTGPASRAWFVCGVHCHCLFSNLYEHLCLCMYNRSADVINSSVGTASNLDEAVAVPLPSAPGVHGSSLEGVPSPDSPLLLPRERVPTTGALGKTVSTDEAFLSALVHLSRTLLQLNLPRLPLPFWFVSSFFTAQAHALITIGRTHRTRSAIFKLSRTQRSGLRARTVLQAVHCIAKMLPPPHTDQGRASAAPAV